MMLSGNLSNWPVTDLLQIMKVTQKTAALRIDGSRPGVIHFMSGQIAGAAVAGQRTPSTPDETRRATIDALYVLVGNNDGSFLVADPEVTDGQTLWDATEIMAEVDRLRMIEGDIKREGIDEATPLRLSAVASSPVTLHADDWEALAALVPSFSINSLEPGLGRSRALAVVATLISRSLAVPDDRFAALDPMSMSALDPGEPPVLDWLSEVPAEQGADLSTDLITTVHPLPAEETEEPHEETVQAERRALRSVVASPGTTLVSGVLDDMRKLRTNG
ncbi:MAG TPA: DUF4388 domain-containing protein [Acidimicrobiia bacterium]|nr:DUF4388 domain-containing protein [Acidimicrobiia bacterium]